MSVTVCPRKFGPRGRCGAVLDLSTVDGRLVERCWACERLRRGICRDCPSPVRGKVGIARRCARCQVIEDKAAVDRYQRRHRKAINRRSKMRMRKPAVKRRALETHRAWVKANPEKTRAQRKRRQLRQARAERAQRRAA